MYQCSHCKTGVMATPEQYEVHIKSQKHVKKAFQLQAPFGGIEYEEFRPKTTVRQTAFVAAREDFPSLPGPSSTVTTPEILPYGNIRNNFQLPTNSEPIVETNGHTEEPEEVEDTLISIDDVFFKDGAKIGAAKHTIDHYIKNNKTACAALNEIAKQMNWELDFQQVAGANQGYRFAVSIDKVELAYGVGDNKKIAKQEASADAIKVIRHKLKEGRARAAQQANPASVPNGSSSLGASNQNRTDQSNQNVRNPFCRFPKPKEEELPADAYCKLTLDKLLSIEGLSSNKFVIPRRYAAFIMTNSEKQLAKDGVVVAFAAGNGVLKRTAAMKECPGYHLTNFDSLVLAKRSFQCFLYQQLALIFDKTIPKNKTEKLYFEVDQNEGRVKLKTGCRVHLYMSHAPYGDCVESLGANWTNPTQIPQADIDRDKNGILNPKMTMTYSCDKFVKQPGHIRVLRDENNANGDGWISLVDFRAKQKEVPDHLVMSPSDKLMSWVHAGVHGALLSHLMQPLYLYSIQVAYDYLHEHFSRALICRVPLSMLESVDRAFKDPYIARVSKLPEPVKPLLGLSRQNVSFNWYMNNVTEMPEIVDNAKGLVDKYSPFKLPEGNDDYLCSRLSKVCMLIRLKKMFNLASDYFADKPQLHRTRYLRGINDSAGYVYNKYKNSAIEYRSMKQCVFQAMAAKNYGEWAPNNEANRFDLLQYYRL